MYISRLGDPNYIPPAGVTAGGAPCTCFCHTQPGVMHVMACCFVKPKSLKEGTDDGVQFLTEDESE